jgi:hypothetical protein
MNNRFCVYTVLLGDYETLNEQPVARDSQTDFICFTDNRNIVSNSWKFSYIDPVFPMDLARSSRIPKLCPHRHLKDYDSSLYIDNSIILKKTPEVIYKDFMESKNVDMVCIKHSYRETVLDEFIEVAWLQLDDLNTIMEQLNTYHLTTPEVLIEKPYMSGLLLRKHNDDCVVKTMEEWLAHVLRYSRRDQLSLNYVLRKNKPRVDALDLDFRNSEYLQWPVVYGREREKYKRSVFLSSLLMDKIEKSEKELAEIHSSRAWKYVQPLRRLFAWLKTIKS